MIFGIPVFAAIVAAFSTWHWLSSPQKANSREITCLSAVVPSVVLHHDQEQIVQLLHGLANESNEPLPEDLQVQSIKPVFSRQVDEQLLKIARLFQLRGDEALLEQGDVLSSMSQALEAFRKEAPAYLEGCLQRLDEAQADCGNIENPSDKEKLCLEKHSESINRWAQKFLPGG